MLGVVDVVGGQGMDRNRMRDGTILGWDIMALIEKFRDEFEEMVGFMSWSNDGRGTVIVVLLKLWLQVEASKKATMSRQRGCCVAWWQYLSDYLPMNWTQES